MLSGHTCCRLTDLVSKVLIIYNNTQKKQAFAYKWKKGTSYTNCLKKEESENPKTLVFFFFIFTFSSLKTKISYLRQWNMCKLHEEEKNHRLS